MTPARPLGVSENLKVYTYKRIVHERSGAIETGSGLRIRPSAGAANDGVPVAS